MATKANLVIDQGSTYSVILNITNTEDEVINLAGFTASAQIRKHYTSLTYTAFTTSLDEAEGNIILSLTAEQTANLAAGRYVYDVELISNNVISRIIEGIVTVTPNVTR